MFTLRVLHGTPLFPSVLPQNTFPSSATMATSLSSSHKASYLGRGGGEGNVLRLVLQRVPLVTAALDVAGGSGCPCMCVGGGGVQGVHAELVSISSIRSLSPCSRGHS